MTENYVEHAAASGISSSNSREDSSSSSSGDDDDDVLTAFVSAIPSKGTKKEYLIRLRYFFDAIHVPGKTLADQASNFLYQIAAAANPNPKYGQDCLQKFKGYLKERFDNREAAVSKITCLLPSCFMK